MLWAPSSASLGGQSPAHLDTLLGNGCTLEDILERDAVMQEVSDERLSGFLQQPEQLGKMIQYVTSMPLDGSDEKSLKYACISCAILTCESAGIAPTIVENEELMSLLFSFLEPDRVHGPVLSGYFSKVVTFLLVTETVPVLTYIQNHQDILKNMVDLIGLTSIMEILIRLIDANDNKQAWCPDEWSGEWLSDTKLIELLAQKLDSSNPFDVNGNASSVLSLLTRLYNPGLRWKLLGFMDQILNQDLSKGFATLSLCISLLDLTNGKQVYSVDHSSDTVRMMDIMLGKLGDLVKLLDVSNDETSLLTTYGELRPPFGRLRLKIVELIVIMLKTSPEHVGSALVELGGIELLLKLFFAYPFHNMLHRHVVAVIFFILESGDPGLINHLFEDCNILEKILSQEENPYAHESRAQSTGKQPPRVGNIGHLSRIANHINSVDNPLVQRFVKADSGYVDWCSDVLDQRNAVENVNQWACGRPRPVEERPLENNEDDYRDRDIDVLTLGHNLSRELFRYVDTEGEVHSCFDDVDEIVITSLSLGRDDQESSRLFGANAPWYGFQEETLSLGDSPPRGEGIGFPFPDANSESDSSSTSSDDEVVVGEDDELADLAASTNGCREEVQAEVPGASQSHKDMEEITSDFESIDLADKGKDDDGQFDGGTVHTNGSLLVEPVRQQQLAGVEAEGTAKAMEKALILGEAASLHPKSAEQVGDAEEDDEVSDEMLEPNYWRSEYEQSVMAELEEDMKVRYR